MIIGYTTGVFDLFHIGHLNMLRNSKAMCDKLIVGVSTDILVKKSKNKSPTIPFKERMEIVKSVRYVDCVVPQENKNKLEAWKKLKFDLMFVGDDWYGDNNWKKYEEQLKVHGVKIIYFPYTKNVSSTIIQKKLERI